MTTRLTSLSHGAGCGCKIPAAALTPLLSQLPVREDPRLLVGPERSDDAAVYQLSDELVLVMTADFFTPIVDDPYAFGRIAATNALSDVYAMGASPVLALNLVAYSLEALGEGPLVEILKGGADAAHAAGVSIGGGHSIDDPEPKYGLSVLGTAHPSEILSNRTAQAGDALVLSKPLGGSVVSTAAKRDLAPSGLVERTTAVMTELNADALRAARRAGAHALTDVTGFGLLGHLHELALASGLAAEVSARQVPAIDGVLDLLRAGANVIAGGTRRNREHAESFTGFADDVPEELRWLCCDAMTSGGLLAAVPPATAERAQGARIGSLVRGAPGAVHVRG